MSKKDEYFTMMEAQIKKWDAEVDKLRARSHEMSAEARAKYDAQLKAMRASRDAANKKLQEMRAASESAHADRRGHRVGVDEERFGESVLTVQEVGCKRQIETTPRAE